MRCTALVLVVLVLSALPVTPPALAGPEDAWTAPSVHLQDDPRPAATREELARLRAAWADAEDPGHAPLLRIVERARSALEHPLVFPPEGGHHNQWYQCETCQLALKTVDAHHHGCPRCERVYSGFPFDNVVYAKQHRRNASHASDLAWAWALTGREAFAERAAAILVGYGERYAGYPPIAASVGTPGKAKIRLHPWARKTYGHVLSQTLSEAAWVIPLVEAYDLLRDALSPAQRSTILEGLFRPLADRLVDTKLGTSNWQTWHDAALLWLGAALEDASLVERAIADPKNGFAKQMRVAVTGDGMWDEGSWGYHYYTLSALTWLAEGARRLGVDLYGHPTLRTMYRIGLRYRMPDGSLPRFGDDVQSRPDRPFENEAAFAAYGDERLLAALPAEPTLRSVLLGRTVYGAPAEAPAASDLFPAAGHVILRAGGTSGLAAAATFGPYGGFHGHFDKLSVVLFGAGQEVGVDPGRAKSQAYRLPIHSRWYKATISHNAVLVDGKGQRPAEGELLVADLAADAPWAWLDAGPAYAGATHRRLLLLTDRFLVVVDDLAATDGQAHDFHWLWHGRGAGVTDAPPSDAGLPTTTGFEFVKDVQAHAPAGDVHVRFIARDVCTHVRLVGEAGDRLVLATGPFRSVTDRAPLLALARRGPAARFVALVEPVPEGGEPGARGVRARVVGETLVVEVEGPGGGSWKVPIPGD